MSEKPDYNIAVLARALDLLEALAEADEPLGVTELARRIGATKSAVYRILATLEARDYVSKDFATTSYQLGVRMSYLGERSLRALDVRHVARPALEALASTFNETVNLGILTGTDVVYVDMVESEHGLRMAARLGGRDPAYSTSLGKAILAFLPEAELAQHVPSQLSARTDATITSLIELRAELERIRAAGVAEDRGENEVGARCFGAPILNHAGSVIAAISVSGPESRLDDSRAREVAEAVRAAAEEVSVRLGGRSPVHAATGG